MSGTASWTLGSRAKWLLQGAILTIVMAAIFLSGGRTASAALLSGPWRGTDLATTGAVSLTFDDGYVNQYLLGYKLAQERSIHGTVYYITKRLRDNRYISGHRLQKMAANGWEIGSHTVNHPHLTQLSLEQADYELRVSQQVLSALGLHVTTFAYPYGEYNDVIVGLTSDYYASARTCLWGLNSLPPHYQLRCKGVDAAKSIDDIKYWIRDAKAQKKWLIILMHDIRPDYQATSPHMSVTNYRLMLDYIRYKQLPTPTVAEVVAAYPPVPVGTF